MGTLYDEPMVYTKQSILTGLHNNGQKEDTKSPAGRPQFFAGQNVKGIITKIGKSITFNIEGTSVKAPGNLIKDASLGMSVTLKVLSVTDTQVKLQLADSFANGDRKSFISIIKLNSDRSIISSLKEIDAKRAEREDKIKASKKSMGDVAFRMTGKDYGHLEKEGLSADKMSLRELSTALTRLKKKAEKQESPDNQRSGKGFNASDEEYIQKKLKEFNLPADEKTVKQVLGALNLSKTALNMDENTVKGLFMRGLKPTIGNMYKSQFDRGNNMSSSSVSDEEWDKLLPQVKDILKASNYEINEETLKNAKWLVDNNIPLNRENLDHLEGLRNLDQYMDEELILNNILEGMAGGLAPEDIPLLPVYKYRAERLITGIESIEEEDISRAVLEDRDLTIEELEKIHNEALEETDIESDRLSKEQLYEAARAQRLMEEIRLKMTVEAAVRLMKQGIYIETAELDKVVEQLRLLEDNIYSEMLNEAGAASDTGNIQTLKTSLHNVDRLKDIPIRVIGSTLDTGYRMTISELLEKGDRLAADYNRANEAYEALMTRPDREYGDSIQKAFKNAESLLKEMGIDNTVYNQRAVRILGYNSMDINGENIDRVKAYDLEVNTLIKNLHPAITVRLIKEGINPLSLPIHELNDKIEELKSQMGISKEERFSDYLMKLDRRNELPLAERKAFIGIYRLLHNVERTDGAALGAVIKADMDVTLENLLTAVRIYHKGRMDAVINDEFGLLQERTLRGESITDQIEAAYEAMDELKNSGNESSSNESSSGDVKAEEFLRDTKNNEHITNNEYMDNIEADGNADFLNKVIRQLGEDMTPGKLEFIQERVRAASDALTRSQSAPASETAAGGIWNTLRSMPVEALFDLAAEYKDDYNSEESVYEHKLQQMKEMFKDSEQAIRFLEDYRVPCTPANILAAGQILTKGGTWYKRLTGLRNEDSSSDKEKELKKSFELADKLTDRQSMENAYQELNEMAAAEIDEQLGTGPIDAEKLTELKSMRIQLSLAGKLAQREFYQIPLETKNGITNINVTIIRQGSETGRATVTVYSGKLGRLKADMSLKDNNTSGLIICDSMMGRDILEGFLEGYKGTLKECGIEVKQLDTVLDKGTNDSSPFRELGAGQPDTFHKESERLLYRIAREFILMIRDAELSV